MSKILGGCTSVSIVRATVGFVRRAGSFGVDACERASFTPHVVYTSDDVIVQQALVAADMGVTTMPGLTLRTHRAPGIEATPLPDFRRRVYIATYGDPPDPPATTAFITALHHAVQQTRPGEPPPPDKPPNRRSSKKNRRSTESAN